MPSPVGHAIGALAAGWIVAPAPPTRRAAWIQAACIVACGIAPDLDLLAGRHSAQTHSIGAAVLAASMAAAVRWPIARTRGRIWIATCAAWLSHPILDALGTDNAPPVGVMAWWPISHAYYLTGLNLFWPISRHWHEAALVTDNLAAAGREILILAPLAALAWWIQARHGRARSSAGPIQG